MLKAIVFDHGGVLVEDLITRYFSEHEKVLSPEQKQKYLDLDYRACRGLADKEEYQRVFDEVFGPGEFVKLDTLQKVKDASPDPRLVGLIKKLKKNFKIGLLSNNYSFWSKWIRHQEYMKLFDQAVFSCEVGVAKPEEKIYQIIAEKLMAAPVGCVFIDNIQINVTGGENAGMKGIKYQSYDDLLRDLLELGIN